jgi:UDP-N-acetylmuramoylalanine--D-glutamate ligase
MKRESFAGKRVLVMGLGRFGGGVDVARFTHRAGAKITVTDLASVQKLSDSIRELEELEGITFHLGAHDPSDFEQADIVVANPAVPGDNEFLQIARRAGKFVTSQVNIFFELCPAPIIGITGANGKSTTAALTAHLLGSARYEIRDTRYDDRPGHDRSVDKNRAGAGHCGF